VRCEVLILAERAVTAGGEGPAAVGLSGGWMVYEAKLLPGRVRRRVKCPSCGKPGLLCHRAFAVCHVCNHCAKR